jgi:hypothetical protein
MTDTPVSEEKVAEAKAIGAEIRTAMEVVRSSGTMNARASSSNAPASSFMEHAPDTLKVRLAGRDLQALEREGAQLGATGAAGGLLRSAFGCGVCTTGMYVGIAALLGASIILSGGMSIPAVLAASGYSMSGLAVVISAMTGVSAGAVTALLTAAGTTLGLVVLGLCEAIGWC